MQKTIKLSVTFPVKPSVIYNAWLNSEKHSAFTGGKAKITDQVGKKYTAWDNYISGKNLELVRYKKIVQSWRSTDFPEGTPDSKIEVILEGIEGKTKLTLIHSEIPDNVRSDYKQGWKDFYFKPMKKYFK